MYDKLYTSRFSLTNYIQMDKEYPGEFEELVLTMVGILQEEAYGNAIVGEIRERIGREVNLSAVHVTLYRLEDKGYLKSLMGGATSARGVEEKGFSENECGTRDASRAQRIQDGHVEIDSAVKIWAI
jgi:DNA-binding PadR family transcriptional regulator